MPVLTLKQKTNCPIPWSLSHRFSETICYLEPHIAMFEKPDKTSKSVVTSFTFSHCSDSVVPNDNDDGGAGTQFSRENGAVKKVTKYQVHSAENLLNSDNKR